MTGRWRVRLLQMGYLPDRLTLWLWQVCVYWPDRLKFWWALR